jgi:hypothetical protein
VSSLERKVSKLYDLFHSMVTIANADALYTTNNWLSTDPTSERWFSGIRGDLL